MTKTSMALVGMLVLAAAAPSAAFATVTSNHSAMTQGQAIDECRAQTDPTTDNHHTRPARIACVQRLLHANQSTY